MDFIFQTITKAEQSFQDLSYLAEQLRVSQERLNLPLILQPGFWGLLPDLTFSERTKPLSLYTKAETLNNTSDNQGDHCIIAECATSIPPIANNNIDLSNQVIQKCEEDGD